MHLTLSHNALIFPSIVWWKVLSSDHGDFYRAIAGGRGASNQIEFMKKYGSSAPLQGNVRELFLSKTSIY